MGKNINVVTTPILLEYHKPAPTSVLIDVARFTSTLTTALANGAESVECLNDIQKALDLKKNYNYLIAGEHYGADIEGFDFNNSPVAMTQNVLTNRKMAFITTNGTYTLPLIKDSKKTIAGCFLNVSAVIDELLKEDSDINLVCSGRQRKTAIEDLIYAGMIADILSKNHKYKLADDDSYIAIAMYNLSKKNIRQFVINNSPSVKITNKKFPRYSEDLKFLFQQDIFDIVPIESEPLKFVLSR